MQCLSLHKNSQLMISNSISSTESTFGQTITNFVVPKTAFEGHSVYLICDYSLPRGQKLYNLKWYKEEQEFWRYEPQAKPKFKALPVNGVNLEVRCQIFFFSEGLLGLFLFPAINFEQHTRIAIESKQTFKRKLYMRIDQRFKLQSNLQRWQTNSSA